NLLPINDGSGIALCGQLGKKFNELALTSSYHRRQYLESGTLFKFKQLIHDLLGRLLRSRLTTLWAAWNTDTCPQQQHVIMNFGNSTDRRAGVFRGRLLINRYRRR